MNTRLTPTEFAAALDAAEARAHALRGEAIRAAWNALGPDDGAVADRACEEREGG